MSLSDIDAAATRRRIQEIADSSRKAFEAHAQRSAEIDAAFREAAAKEEADLKAVQERNAAAEARKAEAEAAEKKQDKPKPATLSLGAEEFREARQAGKARPEPEPPATKEEPPATKEEPPRPNRTLKLGAQEDEPEQDKPVRKRSPRPEADDDMSGRTWLR
jgi:hypothetical protein